MSPLRRLSIRARLTVAFAASLVAVLALAAVFVYARVDSALTESTDEALASRLDGLEALVASAGPNLDDAPAADSEDNFSQVLDPGGQVLASTLPGPSGPALDPGEAAAAASRRVLLDGVALDGVDGDARVLAGPVTGPGGRYVVVAGTSTQDRSETLSEIAAAFALGAPLALLIASGVGYLLARRALRPIEAMRNRAEQIGGRRSGERLPLPEADDEVRALGETLNSMLERLEAALAREQQFVADASHELRTPLAILKAELELAEHEGRDPAQLRAAIGSALTEVDRLGRLADDLLVAARSDRGRIPIRRERVDFGALAERVAARFERVLGRESRELSLEIPARLEASLDPLRAEQVLANLIDNAVRHGGGAVRIRAGSNPDGSIWAEVADEGPGFSDGFAGAAFERFSRPDGSRGGTGTGLGLAIVRALAEAHGGDAEIVAGDGATVRVRFGAESA